MKSIRSILAGLKPLLPVLCVVWLGSVTLLQRTDAAGMQGELPVLTERLGKYSQEADFIIVLDRSGSMSPFWGLVKTGIADFVDAIPQGDYISILYFESDAGDLVTPRQVSKDNREALKQQILSLPAPNGRFTDLGRAVDRTLDELNRPDANTLQFVFFFTDFAHDPQPASRWSSRDCSGRVWEELKAKKKRLIDDQNHLVKTYALELPLGGSVGRDIGLFQCAFEKFEKASIVDSGALRAWFDRRRKEVLRDKLRVQAEDEMSRGVDISPVNAEGFSIHAGKEASLRCSVKSNFRALDVSLSDFNLRFDTADGPFQASANDGDIFLAPGEAKEATLTIRNLSPDGSVLPVSEPLALPVFVSASYVVSPETELGILNVEPGGKSVAAFELKGRLTRGYPWWLLAISSAIAAAVFILTGAKLWNNFKPSYLYGTLQDESRPVGGQAVKRLFKSRERLKEITIGTSAANILLAAADEDACLKLVAKRKPKRGVYVQLIEGQARLDGKHLGKSRAERLRQGKSRIEIAGYTLRWM